MIVKADMPLCIVLIGPPACGKGTTSRYLAEQLGILAISSGEMLREEVSNQTELGRLAKEYIDSGLLVPEDLVVDMIRERIKREDCKRGFILDGFPRTKSQAETLDKILKERGMEVNFVVMHECSDETLLIRSINRAEKAQNRGENPRSADVETKKYLNRLRTYRLMTKPRLEEYYSESQRFYISTEGGKNEQNAGIKPLVLFIKAEIEELENPEIKLEKITSKDVATKVLYRIVREMSPDGDEEFIKFMFNLRGWPEDIEDINSKVGFDNPSRLLRRAEEIILIRELIEKLKEANRECCLIYKPYELLDIGSEPQYDVSQVIFVGFNQETIKERIEVIKRKIDIDEIWRYEGGYKDMFITSSIFVGVETQKGVEVDILINICKDEGALDTLIFVPEKDETRNIIFRQIGRNRNISRGVVQEDHQQETNPIIKKAFNEGRIIQDSALAQQAIDYFQEQGQPEAARLIKQTNFYLLQIDETASPRAPPCFIWYESPNRFVLAHAGTYGNEPNAYIPSALIDTLINQNVPVELIARILLHEAQDANELLNNLPSRLSHQAEVKELLAELEDIPGIFVRFPPQESDLEAKDLPRQIIEFWRDIHHVYMNPDNPEDKRQEALEKTFRIAARKHKRDKYPTALEIWKNAKDILTEFYIAWPNWPLWQKQGKEIWRSALKIAKEAFMDVDEKGIPKQFWVYDLLVEAIKPAMNKREYNAELIQAIIDWLESNQPAPLKKVAADMLGEMGIEKALPLLIDSLDTENDIWVLKAYLEAIRAFGKGKGLDNAILIRLLDKAKSLSEEKPALAKALVEIWGEIEYRQEKGWLQLQRLIREFLAEAALSDNEGINDIAVHSLSNLPISRGMDIPEENRTKDQKENRQEILNKMIEKTPKAVMKKLLQNSNIDKIEHGTGTSIVSLLTYWSEESEDFAVKREPRTPERISEIAPEEAAQGEPDQRVQYSADELEYIRPFWEIGTVHSNPIDLYYKKGTDKDDPANWVLLKGGNEYTLSMDYIGTRLFQLAGLPTAPVSLVELADGELRLAIGFMKGYKDGGYSLPKKYHHDPLIQAGFLFDALINSQDRHPSNMMFKSIPYNVSREDKDELIRLIDRIFVDFGASGISRATGGFERFPEKITEKDLLIILLGARNTAWGDEIAKGTTLKNVKFDNPVNEAYGALIEDFQKGGKLLQEFAKVVAAVTDEQIEAIVKSAQLPN